MKRHDRLHRRYVQAHNILLWREWDLAPAEGQEALVTQPDPRSARRACDSVSSEVERNRLRGRSIRPNLRKLTAVNFGSLSRSLGANAGEGGGLGHEKLTAVNFSIGALATPNDR